MLKQAINRPITTIMIFLSLLLFGAYAIKILPINLYPSVDIPLIKVTTIARGELSFIENQITKELEDAIGSVSGIEKISSKSFDNISIIVVQFELGRDLDQAASDIKEKISAKNLNAKTAVEKISSDAGMVLGLFARPKSLAQQHNFDAYAIYNDAKMLDFMQTVDEVIKPNLLRAKGIGELKMHGFFKPQISIQIDKNALNKHHLDPATLADLIISRNQKVFLGTLQNRGDFGVDAQKSEQIFSAKAEFAPQSIAELAGLKLLDGVYLKDIATVQLDSGELTSYAQFDQPGVLIDLHKISHTDTLSAIKEAKKQLEKLRAQLVDVDFHIVFDKGDEISKHLRQVVFDMVFGILLTIFIVFIFLRKFSATIIASIAIPISIISSFGLIYLFGYDLNRLTLIALTLAIGIFVDDAIVVIERICAAKSSSNALQNAYIQTRDIAFSVFSISLVLLCVFIPISFMNSIPGLFFNTLGMSVSFGIIISFLVCIFLVPTLAARFLNPAPSAFEQRTERYFLALENAYERILRFILAHKGAFVVGIFAISAAAFMLAARVGLDFLPMEDNSEFFVELTSRKDISLQQSTQNARELASQISAHKGVKFTTIKVAYDDAHDRKKAQIYVRLEPLGELRSQRQSEFIRELRKELKAPHESTIKLIEVPKFAGAGVDDPVQFAILGERLSQLASASEQIREQLAQISGVVDIADDFDAPLNVQSIKINEQACLRAQVLPTALAKLLNAALADAQIGHLISEQSSQQLHIKLKDTSSLAALNGLKITNARGEKIDVMSLLHINSTLQNSAINHLERLRSIKITASTENIALHEVKLRLDAIAAPILAANHIDAKWQGFVDLLGQTISGFVAVVILAFVLIYMVLAALYESLIVPLIIMLTMPLAFVGASFALYFAGFSFSLFVLVALILLFGMVGKNAILLIDVAMTRLRAGDSPERALVIAGRSRIRAILMTTFAMIGAMLPLALSRSSGYEANAPMALAVIGGLISSTLLTLFIIPALFGLCCRFDSYLRRIYERPKID